MKLLLVGLLLVSASMSFAAPVWYGGDNDDDFLGGWTAISGTPNGSSNQEFMAYEDFTWNSASSAASIMGTMLGTSSFSQVKWEIRQGMSVATQNTGTVVASGVSNVSLVSLGAWSLNNTRTKYAMTGNIAPVSLTNGGSYFLGMSIVVPSSTFTGGFIATGGTNAVGTPFQNHNSFYISPTNGMHNYQPGVGNPPDLSMGIGTATVPEPASLAVLGIGVLAMIKQRRK